MVERLFLAVPWGCLRFVIVVFPDHTHLLFLYPQAATVFIDWFALSNNKEYYMGAHVSLNLLNKFGNERKCDRIQALFDFC